MFILHQKNKVNDSQTINLNQKLAELHQYQIFVNCPIFAHDDLWNLIIFHLEYFFIAYHESISCYLTMGLINYSLNKSQERFLVEE